MVSVVGCATVKRDIYFQYSTAGDDDVGRTLPGRVASLKTISPDNRDAFLRIQSSNSASGSYTFGILIPFIPVFFLPGNEFSLNTDNLSLDCYVQVFSTTIGKCQNLKVATDDGKLLSPLLKRENSKNGFTVTTFTFDKKANEIKRFVVTNIEIKFDSGEDVALKQTFDMRLKDWTRYNLVKVAP
jgi:hypothetical protein